MARAGLMTKRGKLAMLFEIVGVVAPSSAVVSLLSSLAFPFLRPKPV